MTSRNRIMKSMALAAMLGFLGTSAAAQSPTYYGALLYSMPRDTTLPPLYAGQPAQVTTAYLWLDDAMRLYPESTIESYLNNLSWDDTAKTIASNFYQMKDDNPLSFFLWEEGESIKPNPYKGQPGRAEEVFENLARHIGDNGVTNWLLSDDIIADVMISDTFCGYDPTAMKAKDRVLVNSNILDEIKGKWIPACPNLMRSKSNEVRTLGVTGAQPTFADTAAAGTCLQFEYSPEWRRSPNEDVLYNSLKDTAGGWWIKPGVEYIIFLRIRGIGDDSSSVYFSIWPGSGISGNSGGMYPVIGGIVQDPHDDFELGGTNLTVSDWKTRLRTKMNSIVNP